MSWESSAVYYRLLNEEIRRSRGGLHSANLIMRSLDFANIVRLQQSGNWQSASQILRAIGESLQQGGAECLLICTNTMHKLAEDVQGAVRVPLLNIIDVTANAIRRQGLVRPLLLATRYTMEEDFYIARIRDRHCLAPIIPGASDRAHVHRIIFDELCCGQVLDQSRETYRKIVERGRAAGADSVILGCTEIGLLVGAADLCLPTFDSTALHVEAAVDFSLGRPAHGDRPTSENTSI
jgi:aspartate racemase